jgi:hemin uptake protein HemP
MSSPSAALPAIPLPPASRTVHAVPAASFAASPPIRPGRSVRRLPSASLLSGDAEVEIEHGEAVYRLRLTALGKLILTK